MQDQSHEQVNAAGVKRIKEAIEKGTHNIIQLCNYESLPYPHRLMIQTVQLSADQNAGDIYYHSLSKKWCLHHLALLKLAMAANIQWEPSITIENTRDTVHVQSMASIFKEFNHKITFSGDCSMSRLGMLEKFGLEAEAAYIKKYVRVDKPPKNPPPKDEWCENRARKELARVWPDKIKRAATSSKSIVIMKLLGIQPGYARKEDVLRPWLVIRCIVAPDFSDPESKRQLNAAAIRAMTGVYGIEDNPMPSPQQRQLPETIVPAEPIDNEEAPDSDEGDPSNMPFEEWDPDTQNQAIEQLIKATNYDLEAMRKAGHADWHEFSDTKKKNFYDHLLSLKEDDIPY